MKLKTWLKQIFCRHRFNLKDLKGTGLEGKKRVSWECFKCGRVFYAHCGLDIIPTKGHVVNEPTDS